MRPKVQRLPDQDRHAFGADERQIVPSRATSAVESRRARADDGDDDVVTIAAWTILEARPVTPLAILGDAVTCFQERGC